MDEEQLEQALMNLYRLGLVSVDYDENLVARFAITDEGKLKLHIKKMGGKTDDV